MTRLLTGTIIVVAVAAALSFAAPAEAQIFYPAPTVVYRPVVPTYVAPRTVYYGGPAVVAAPAFTRVPVTTTRYRPILGGTVSRTRYYWAPTTVVAPAW